VSEEPSVLGLHWLRKTARYSCGVPQENKEETPDALMRSIENELAEKRARWRNAAPARDTHTKAAFSSMNGA
jgi:hypothetical protein